MTLFCVWDNEKQSYKVSKTFSENITTTLNRAREIVKENNLGHVVVVAGKFYFLMQEEDTIRGGLLENCCDRILKKTVEVEIAKQELDEVEQRIETRGVLRRNRIAQNA